MKSTLSHSIQRTIVNDVWTTNHETDALGSGLTAKSHVETDWQSCWFACYPLHLTVRQGYKEQHEEVVVGG